MRFIVRSNTRRPPIKICIIKRLPDLRSYPSLPPSIPPSLLLLEFGLFAGPVQVNVVVVFGLVVASGEVGKVRAPWREGGRKEGREGGREGGSI